MDETPKLERWLSRSGTKTKRSFSVKKSIRRVLKREDVESMPTELDSGEYEFLCTVCTRLLTSPASQKKLFSKHGFARDSKLHEGCRLCQQVVELLQARDHSASTRKDFSSCTLHAMDKNRSYIYEFSVGHGYAGLNPDEQTSGPAELTQLAFLQVRLGAGAGDQADISSQSLLRIAPCFNDASESMFAAGNPPVHDFDLSGDFLVRRARAQIRDCRKNHPQCKVSSTRLPKRVIDVNGSGDGSNVRLHITGRHENMAYLALSYCWGGPQKVTTTTRNLGAHLTGIPKTSLDQTIQDAILMTRKLGIHYLWVDSLCIIQDDEEDKEREIRVMDDVYRNATLTLAAATSKSASEGFLSSSKASILGAKHKLPLRLPDGELGFITAIAEKTVRGPTGWALDTRAWALQEFMLSRRLLIFGDGDVRFQCHKLDLEPVVPSPITYDSKIERLPHPQDLQTFLKVTWYDLIEKYSARHLTDENDRLVAISGIAKQIQERVVQRPEGQMDEYFVGLWKSGLAGNLLWYTHQLVPPESSGTRSPFTSSTPPPSFSWASLGSAVRFLGVLTSSLEFVQWGERADDFGTSGVVVTGQFSTLTVNAYALPLSRLLLDQLPKMCGVDAITLQDLSCVLHIWQDYEGREGFDVSDSSLLMRIDDGANIRDNRGLILNRLEGGYYRRVGVYSELDWNSRPKSVEVDDPAKKRLLRRLTGVLSTTEAWEGYRKIGITLI